MPKQQFSEKQLITAAKELNDELGLDPAIDTEAEAEELQEKITEACALVEKGDTFTEEVAAVLKGLEPGLPNIKIKKGEKKKAEAESGPEKPIKEPSKEKKAVPKPSTEKQMSRIEAAVKAYSENKTENAADLAKAADAIYVEAGGKSNKKEAIGICRKVLKVIENGRKYGLCK